MFAGDGVTPGAPVPDGAGLDDIAPTVAEIIALQRAHPEVRSGTPIEGVASGKPPHLVLEVVLKGLGSKELSAHPRALPTLKSLMEHGAATMSGEVGSLPLDPAASLTTIGTGGMPSQHGITGSMIRNDQGQLVIAWGRGSPVNVIATLGDDLDQKFHQEPEIGMVGSDQSDRGLIGGSWYVDIDRDLFIKSSKNPAQAAAGMLKDGFGKDDVPDLLGVALEGSLLQMDEALKTVLRAARRASQGSFAVVVTATGSLRQASGSTVQPKEVVRGIELAVGAKRRIVEAVGAGGLFLDQKTVAKASISDDEVLNPLLAMKAPNGQPLVADAFPAIAVSFARYC